MDKDKVLHLAKLSRIKLGESEAKELSREFGEILQYVGEVKEAGKVSSDVSYGHEGLKNMMREDSLSHESGLYTKALLEGAPKRDGNYFKVKKIL